MKSMTVLFFTVCILIASATQSYAYQNKVLIMYDQEGEAAQDLAHEHTVANLMGHFKLPNCFTKKVLETKSLPHIKKYSK